MASTISSAPALAHSDFKKDADIDAVQLEHVLSSDELSKEHMDYNRVDQEVATYATATGIEISPEDDKRLKKLIDRRVLSIMVFTYFLQALDKGTLSFSSIMGIKKDLHLVGQQVSDVLIVTRAHEEVLMTCSTPG